MILCKTTAELEARLHPIRKKQAPIGFVPTMGALHQGHLSLVRESKKRCACTVVSIFVNPTQFNNPDDLTRYPRNLEYDCALLENEGVDVIFAPTEQEIYPRPDTRSFDLGTLDKTGEGLYRPGHFNGVVQVVTRLFDIVRPQFAFFGEKDFQQLAIIRYMTKELRYPVTIVACPLIREQDGLAMSSRNMLLTPEQRAAAPLIAKTLFAAKERIPQESPEALKPWITTEINRNPELEVEYIDIVNAQTLQPITAWTDADEIQACIAVFARPVRLIDNIKLK